MSDDCKKFVREPYPWEIDEFRPVFGNTLDFSRVSIHECTMWPDAIDRLGRFLKRLPPPGEREHNALTLGNHCYFPVRLPKTLPAKGDRDEFKLDWLVHELTHAWQYQHTGWRYLFKALWAQFREKARAYDFGGEDGLLKSRKKEKSFKEFNPEQQGSITQSFYKRSRKGDDVKAWKPYIDELQNLS
jgi:hypothetical protein